jgi:hypothetical protein
MRSKSSSFNAGFQLEGPLGLDLSRARASSTVQSRAASFKIQIVRELGFPHRGDQGRYDAAMMFYRDQGTALQSVSAFSAGKCFTPSLNPWVSRSSSILNPTQRGRLFVGSVLCKTVMPCRRALMPVPDRSASPRMMPNSSLESAWFDVLRGSYQVSNSDDLSEPRE